MSYAQAQAAAEGTRVTSGTTISATYASNVGAGNLLVAIISRTGASIPPTVGQVTDNHGNKWRQVTEVIDGTSRGLDMWCCESAGGGNQPTVTASLNGFPLNAISGMNMAIMEYSGGSGYELTDAMGTTNGSTTSLSVATNYATTATHDLVLSALVGDQSAATVPSGWTSRIADTTQHLWVAEVDSGASTGVQTAAWTSLTGATHNAAIVAAFRQTGVAATSPHVLQSAYYEPPIQTGQALSNALIGYPVNPTAGNTLVAFVTGANYEGSNSPIITGAKVSAVTDTAGNVWRKIADQGIDNNGGLDWSVWVVNGCKGGTTTLTATWEVPIGTPACLLLELAGCPPALTLDSQGAVVFANTGSVATAKAVLAGDIGFFSFGAVFPRLYVPGAGWTQVNSDMVGVGCHQLYLGTPAGVLTGSVGGASGGDDLTVSAARSAPGIGLH
jgi:hypothetical protein